MMIHSTSRLFVFLRFHTELQISNRYTTEAEHNGRKFAKFFILSVIRNKSSEQVNLQIQKYSQEGKVLQMSGKGWPNHCCMLVRHKPSLIDECPVHYGQNIVFIHLFQNKF